MSTTFGETVGSSLVFCPNQISPRQSADSAPPAAQSDLIDRNGQMQSPNTFTDVYDTPDTEYRGVVLPEDVAFNKPTLEEELRIVILIQEDAPAADLAFNALFTQYRGIIVNALKDLPPHEREDILQQTAFNAYRGIQKGHFNPEKGSIRGWLKRVAINAMRDQRRRDSVRPQEVYSPDEREHVAIQYDPSPQDVEGQVVRQQTIAHALAQLTPLQRDVIVNVTMQGKSVGAYAKEVGIPEGTVKSRTNSALRRLRRLLGDDMDNSNDIR